MPKVSPIKTGKHAPYRKSFLIPLWSLQLSLSFTLFVLSILTLATDDVHGGGYNDYTSWLTLNIIHFLLNLFLTSSVIFVIIKFSKYTLPTQLFKIQSITAVVISGFCTILYLAMTYWSNLVLAGMAWLTSIAICARVCVLRKRVKRGEAAEMKRRTKEMGGDWCGEMEREMELQLEDSNKFRGVEIAGVSKPDTRTALQTGERLQVVTPMPSYNSAATGTSGAPPKYVREVV